MYLERATGFGLWLLLLTHTPAFAADREPAKVLSVSDGDTIVVSLSAIAGRQRVRLLGIDAPEISHGDEVGQEPWGSRAKARLTALIGGRSILLEKGTPPQDRYGRWLALIWLAGRCVNLQMVAEGLAIAYPKGLDASWQGRLKSAEATARAQAIGIWQRIGGLQELPGDRRQQWRHEKVDPALAE